MEKEKFYEKIKAKISSINIKAILKNKKIMILCPLAIVLIIGIVIALSILTNNYMTPVKFLEKYENTGSYSTIDYIIDSNGGLAKNELKKIWKILIKSDDVKEVVEEFEEDRSKEYQRYLDSNPNYKVKLKIVNKDKLEKEDLKKYRELLQDYVYDIQDAVDETEEFTSADWNDIAEEMGLLKNEAKDLIKGFEKLAKKYGRIEVTKGYNLKIERILDEGIPRKYNIVVIKVNGKWMLAEDYRDYYVTRNKLGFNAVGELDLF